MEKLNETELLGIIDTALVLFDSLLHKLDKTDPVVIMMIAQTNAAHDASLELHKKVLE